MISLGKATKHQPLVSKSLCIRRISATSANDNILFKSITAAAFGCVDAIVVEMTAALLTVLHFYRGNRGLSCTTSFFCFLDDSPHHVDENATGVDDTTRVSRTTNVDSYIFANDHVAMISLSVEMCRAVKWVEVK